MHQGIFFDRDGVINKDTGWAVGEYDLELYPEFIRALKLVPPSMKKIVVTNQGWIRKGLLTEEELKKAHSSLISELKRQDLHLDGIYYCPHIDADQCLCRKPKSGMLLKAQEEHNIDLNRSYMIGDQLRDLIAGKNVGCTTILVKTGRAGQDVHNKIDPDYIVENVYEAIKLILNLEKQMA